MTATGKQLNDVLLVCTSGLPIPNDDEYCVEAGSHVLRGIIDSYPPLSGSRIYKDDAWASVRLVGHLGINLSIVWVKEEESKHLWALQFQARRGCVGFLRSRHMSLAEWEIREAVEAAARKSHGISEVRWVSGREFREIY